MKIVDIVWTWWKSLCERFLAPAICGIFMKTVQESSETLGAHKDIVLGHGPVMVEDPKIQSEPLLARGFVEESECPTMNDDAGRCSSCGNYLDAEYDHAEPPVFDISSSTSIHEMRSDSTAGHPKIYELGSSQFSTSSEREKISNMLKELIENMEPTAAGVASRSTANKSRKTAAINLAFNPYKVVEDVAKAFGMKVTSHDKHWDVIWYSRPITEKVCAKFDKSQRANYFPESQRAVWKNNLALCLTKMSKIFPEDYDFFPKSWSLPRDWHLMEKHSRRHAREWYIVKPNNWGCGYGIYLTNEVSKLSTCGKMTAQTYIKRPFLMDGLKFDLRIYVLVTSCKPLRIFVYNEGLARFATEQYEEPDHKNKTNRHMHLTNYAVNKYSPTYVVDENKGTLRRWTTVKEWLTENKIDARSISASMDDVIIKTLIAMSPTLKYHYFRSFPDQAESNSCFQIFGFDIMLGSDLKVYVLEVNGSPQFYADVTLDIEMTRNLIRDAFGILNLAEKPDPSSTGTPKENSRTAQRDSRTLTQSRVEWEDSHLGNFRKIYPNERNKFYNKFMKGADHLLRPL